MKTVAHGWSPSRRDVCTGLIGLVGAAALARCDGDKGEVAEGETSRDEGDDTEIRRDDTDIIGVDTGFEVPWATGGTASMWGNYVDPFTTATSCALICELTLGPCYAETVERKDISEGYTGLPVRLAFQVVNEACEPIEGATVDIWHTSYQGLYSGDDAAQMCTDGDADARAHRFFRGVQTTDASGRVDFDSCFPGWYGGRTVHMHFTVRRGGEAYVTSQLFFPSALIQDIFENHPEYSGFGQPDTTNESDNVLGGTDVDPYLMEYAKMSDGALLAWKRLVIRGSLSDDPCTAGRG
jgi:protocatechuate 3,4-dioxygenase beta subunit